jgi:hypothetical protein
MAQTLRVRLHAAWRRAATVTTASIMARVTPQHLRSPLRLVTFWPRYKGTVMEERVPGIVEIFGCLVHGGR